MNPIPASTATPTMSRQPSDGLSSARVNRVTRNAPPKTPIGLPTTSAEHDADHHRVADQVARRR